MGELVTRVSVRVPAQRLQGAVRDAMEKLKGVPVLVGFFGVERSGIIQEVRYYEERETPYLWVTIELGDEK